jgi:hypothetical protein
MNYRHKITTEELLVKKEAIVDRRSHDPWRNEITDRLDRQEARHSEFREQLATNTAITVTVKTKTDEMYDILETFKGGMKVLSSLGTIAKWVAGIAGAITAVFAVFVGADEFAKHFPNKWFK